MNSKHFSIYKTGIFYQNNLFCDENKLKTVERSIEFLFDCEQMLINFIF
jgi:hypothetical protein